MISRFLQIMFVMQLVYSFPLLAQTVDKESLLHKFSFCLVCHGYQAQGNTTVLAPPLAGIEPWYLSSSLAAYRAGTRHTSAKALEMQAAVRMLDESDEPQLMALLAQMPTVREEAEAASIQQLVRGAQGYAQYCAACHGVEAEGNELLAAPGLARLSSWYLQSAWQAFREGNRGDSQASSAAQQMRQYSQSLPTDLAIEDVIAFLSN